MKKLALVSQKGGVGKSAIAVSLAVAFEESGRKVAVIDLDRQASAQKWGDSRRRPRPQVMGGLADRLAVMLDAAERGGAELAIIDTPPHSDKNALAAVLIADLTLVPTLPEIFDLRAIRETVELLQMAKREARGVILFNGVQPARKAMMEDAEQTAQRYGLEICPARLSRLAPFADALVSGMGVTEFSPRSKSAVEIRDLRSWIALYLHERI
jgi:chromosome partitioning protein